MRIVFGIIGLLAVYVFFLTPQVFAATFTVSTTVDENNGIDSGAGASLREVLGAANASDTIIFNVTGTIRLSGSALNIITDNLTIAGPGAHLLTIDAGGNSRIFTIIGDITTTFTDLDLAGGNAMDAKGGAAFFVSDGQTVNMTRCRVGSNAISFKTDLTGGGGILVQSGGTLSMTKCEVSSNDARAGGFGYGGGIYSSGSLTLIDCMIDHNSSDIGGGLYLALSEADIWGCTITHNNAIQTAGGLLCNNSIIGAPLVSVWDTNITSNTDGSAASSVKDEADTIVETTLTGAKLMTGTITRGEYNEAKVAKDSYPNVSMCKPECGCTSEVCTQTNQAITTMDLADGLVHGCTTALPPR